jgi:hypothetical protein
MSLISAGSISLDSTFKSVEEFYPSPPLGVDSADTSQLVKEKKFHGQFQYFQITQPGSSTVTPLVDPHWFAMRIQIQLSPQSGSESREPDHCGSGT